MTHKQILHRGLAVLVLMLFTVSAFAQAGRTVTGKVTDQSGAPLAGASIVVVGTTYGTMADENGNYQLAVDNPAEAVLEVSFVGYIRQQIPVDNRNVIDVVMVQEAIGLDELVVIGYGTVKKRDLTGSVSSIKTNEIVKTASNNALQSMQGKIAGMDITRNSGESGSGLNISLRGNRSINATNDPLFLVDGIEYGSTLDINASDIASIEVLKDASSTAIYGTRGANGVVIITTKRGMAATGERKLGVSFNSYLSMNSPTNLPRIMDVEKEYRLLAERMRYNVEKTDNSWGSTSLNDFSPEVVLSNTVSPPFEKSLLQLYEEGGVSWFDLILRNSTTQNYELSFSGGSDRSTYVLSLGLMDEQGLMRNDALRRYNGRIAVDHKLTNNIQVGASLLYTFRDWDRREDGIYGQLIKMHPMAQPYLSDGSILNTPSELTISHTNPLLNEVEGYYANNTQGNRLFGNFFLDWQLIKGLRFKTVFGIDQSANRKGEYEDYMCTANYQSGRGSSLLAQNNQSVGFTWENTLNYSLNLGGIHEIQLLAGQSAQQDVYEMHQVSGVAGFDHYGKNSFYELSNIPPASRAITNEFEKESLLSYFGRVNYKLMNRYLLTASVRADGSSVLAEGNKWGYFPSVALAWVLSEESFLSTVSPINHLKLRASWGKSGNAAVVPYMTKTVLGTDQVYYTFGPSIIFSPVPAILGNPDLSWETTATYDIGLDFSILKDRISGSLDYYYSQTSDLLLQKALPASSVYPQVMANVGETENRGFEAALTFRVFEKKDLSWVSDLTYSTNKDKIVALASGETKDVSNPDQALVVGEPVRAFYNYEADGCWSIADAELAAEYGKVPGDIKIIDANNDTIINELDKRLYNKSPRFIVGFNNTISYKGLSLSALIYARVGQWIEYDFNTAYKPTEQDGSPDIDFWTPENQDAKFPRPGIASQNDMPALAYEEASFLKIREMTLSYTLPRKWTSKAAMSNLRLYASLQNYFTFSNLDNYDPERGGAISNPMAKHLVFGLNVEF